MKTLTDLNQEQLESIVKIADSVYDECRNNSAFKSNGYDTWHGIARGVAISFGVYSEQYENSEMDKITIEINKKIYVGC